VDPPPGRTTRVTMLLMGIGAGIIGTGALAAYLRRKSQALAASKPATVERTVGVSQVASFFWGTEPFMLSKLPACFLFGAVSVAATVVLTKPSGPMNSLELAKGPVAATLLWVWGLFNCVSGQLKVKMGGGDEQAAKVAERSLYNTLEQGMAFLPLLWMNAACVDAAMATSLGLHYAFFRMCYPLAYTFYGGFAMPCEMVTQPNYTVIHLMAVSLTWFVCGGGSLFAPAMEPLMGFLFWCPALLVGTVIMSLLWDVPVGAAAGQCNLAWNGPKE